MIFVKKGITSAYSKSSNPYVMIRETIVSKTLWRKLFVDRVLLIILLGRTIFQYLKITERKYLETHLFRIFCTLFQNILHK